MDNILFLKELDVLNNQRDKLFEDLFDDDNIEKVEDIDQKILILKSEYFKGNLKWLEKTIKISDYKSITPAHSEVIYLPEIFELELEITGLKLSCTLNKEEIVSDFYLENELVLNSNNLKISDNIKELKIKVDSSFVYIFINEMEVFKTFKPSDVFSLTL